MFLNVQEFYQHELALVSFDGTTYTYGPNSKTKSSETLAKWIVRDNEIRTGDFYRDDQLDKLESIVLVHLKNLAG